MKAGRKACLRCGEKLIPEETSAVKRHLLSDVPVGILLSGGLDSGLLLALMKEEGGPWPSYTVGYGDSFADDEDGEGFLALGEDGNRGIEGGGGAEVGLVALGGEGNRGIDGGGGVED